MQAVAFLTTLLFFLAVAVAQTPATWPGSFSLNFVTGLNDTTAGLTFDALRAAPQSLSFGSMFYDYATSKAQVIAHEAYAYECARFYNITEPCHLLFSPKGLFAKFPAWGTCCADLPTVHCVPPDWVAQANYTYQGSEMILGVQCRRWGSPDPTVPHHYWDTVAVTADGNHVPCRFSFPNPIQDFYYDVRSFRVGPQDPSMFIVPPTCTQSCKATQKPTS